MEKFKVVIVEDVPLELKGTEGLLKAQVPEAEVIGTASTEGEYLKLMRTAQPDLVLMDLGLQGSTTIGVELCRNTKADHKDIKILVFTGEVLNEKLWIDVLDAGADGIILKTGEMLTRIDITNVMAGKKYVFNEPIMEQIVEPSLIMTLTNMTRDSSDIWHWDIQKTRLLHSKECPSESRASRNVRQNW